MRTSKSDLELVPSARRLIVSLRDMGYDFSQAIADVVDNSIEARASVVDIDVEFDGDRSTVCITDNGRGMTPDRLREALRYGADADYDTDSLGRFGLGLKTASLSQCRRLTVASRSGRQRAVISAYAWDLDHILKTDRWQILPVDLREIPSAPLAKLRDHTGTVVYWKGLDRILGFRRPYGEAARKRLAQMCRDTELHLRMVFHRFIGGEAGAKKLKINFCGYALTPWDPYCRSERATVRLKPTHIPVTFEGVTDDVTVEPFILPSQGAFSSLEAFRDAKGPASWNQQQGFYIYRANRMIQSGGWCNLRVPDEHTKLARIALSFNRGLDNAFRLNVAKMRVLLPEQIRDALDELIVPYVKQAKEVYSNDPDRKSRNPFDNSEIPEQFTVPSPTEGIENKGTEGTESPAMLTFDQWSERVLEAATPQERPTVRKVLARVAGRATR